MNYAKLIEDCQKQLIQNQYDKTIAYSLIYAYDKNVKNLLQLSDVMYQEVPTDILRQVLYGMQELIIEHKPLPYIIGYTWFLGNQYLVNSKVLIPRRETEFWVDHIINIVETYPKLKILDLCCGSGVIGLSVKKQIPRSDVYLLDIDSHAITLTKKNARALKLEVNVLQSDLLKNLLQQKFDVILCNPPYIDKNEILEKSVYDFEPHHALFADHNGLIYYEMICQTIMPYLQNKYLLAFEIGYNQTASVKALILKYLNVEAELLLDQNNLPRALIVNKL